MIIARRHGYKIFDRRRNEYGLLGEESDSARSSDDLLARDYMVGNNDDSMGSIAAMKNPPKRRRCCGTTLYTPNTSRFADYYHSRLLQKFPFLIEMFYWIITYAFYRCTKPLTNALFPNSIWDVAQDHGLAILEFEQFSWLSFLWSVQERHVQQWFMNGHQTFLTVLNRSYALIHIPGTVGYVDIVPRKCLMADNIQVHSLVLLCCSIIQHFRHCSTNHDTYQSLRFRHLHPVPMHATTITSPRVRIP